MRQYAVIPIGRAAHSERLVIAYPDEKTSRDLLAGPSIVALGHSSRKQAEASNCRHGSTAKSSRRTPAETLVANSALALKQSVFRLLPVKEPFSLRKTKSTICGLLQQSFAVAIVVFYSKNLLLSAVRAFVSS
jgi:hypothetical protein